MSEGGLPSRHQRRLRSVGLHLLLIGAATVPIFPIVFVVANSFTPETEILRRIDIDAEPFDRLANLVDKATPSAYVDNYRTVIARNNGLFGTWFRNSVQVAGATTLLGVFLAATAAYAFSRFRFPGHRPALRAFLVIQMFPGIVLIVPLFNILRSLNVRAIFLVPSVIAVIVGVAILFSKLHSRQWHDAIGYGVGGVAGGLAARLPSTGFWITLLGALVVGVVARSNALGRRTGAWADAIRTGTYALAGFGLIVYMLSSAPTSLRLLDSPWGLNFSYSAVAVPFSVYMLKAYFDTVPYSLEEAGRVDGLTHFGAFWRIVIPLSIPGLAVTAFFTFITAWNEFMYAFTFNLSSENFTLPPGLQTLVSQFRTEWGLFSAGSVMVSIPVLIVFFFAQRYLVSGLTAGGMKQ